MAVMTAGMRRYLNANRQSVGLEGGNLEGVRGRQEGVVNRVPESQETQMREEYGLIMTGEQYETLNADLADTKTKRDEASDRLDTAQKNLDAAVSKGNALIEAAKQKVLDQYNNSLVNVRVVNGQNVEANYRLPRSVVDKLNTTVFNRGDGSYTANWVDNGAFYNVDVVPRGTSDAYGKELHEMIGGAQKDTMSILNSQLNIKLDSLGREGQTLAKQQAGYQANIDDSREAIRLAAKSEQDLINDAKERFQTNIGAARDTALSFNRG